jgi:hypothetical protein
LVFPVAMVEILYHQVVAAAAAAQADRPQLLA